MKPSSVARSIQCSTSVVVMMCDMVDPLVLSSMTGYVYLGPMFDHGGVLSMISPTDPNTVIQLKHNISPGNLTLTLWYTSGHLKPDCIVTLLTGTRTLLV